MEYQYASPEAKFTSGYLWPPLVATLRELAPPPRRVFEIGCGNGATAGMLGKLEYEVTGIDASTSGIEIAQKAVPQARLSVASVYDDLAARFGRFPVVVSLEVIEHCEHSRAFMRTFRALLEPGGVGILSTPYHGYWKNLAVVASGRFDHHFNPLWEGGHLKFFSTNTLGRLFRETGFERYSFRRLGRFPALAKSVMAILQG
jgi:2-polyprenyl-6-hydroxyphenyl methylase/3-demethylubiquinone-9 3-methyltransferase